MDIIENFTTKNRTEIKPFEENDCLIVSGLKNDIDDHVFIDHGDEMTVEWDESPGFVSLEDAEVFAQSILLSVSLARKKQAVIRSQCV